MPSILQHLFKKNALADIPVEEIEQCIHQYPFFPLGHLLMAKKLQPNNDAAFHEQFQKTAVYFHNPLWLLHQLQQNEIGKAVDIAVQDFSKPVNGSGDPDATVHDLIEDVVLHQETDYQLPEEASEIQKNAPEDGFTGFLSHGKDDQMPADAEHDSMGAPKIVRENPVPLQAYYTIDYFASQGIKINNEVQADDKLGKQLKSFTEWLKTMRRLPEVTEEVAEKSSDEEVEQLAADSLEENEVITEAMAEVLVKQEKHHRAREVYHKLSLLNPHKMAYFTAKIEELNLH